MRKVELTEDQMVALANLYVTLTENSEGLKKVEDFEGEMNVNEAVGPGVTALHEIMPQFNL